jgi:hypothetical protein
VAAAPYLVRLEQSSELMKWLLLEGWGRYFCGGEGEFTDDATAFSFLINGSTARGEDGLFSLL